MSAPARTPLHALHAGQGARFTPFAGWEMPLQYADGQRAEHLWTRNRAGLFDVSHMGQLVVRGEARETALEAALPLDFDAWPAGRQRYTLLLNDAGGIEDDLMVTRLEDAVAVVVNASRREADLARLRRLCPDASFEWRPAALLALQGPAAETVLAALEPGTRALRFMHAGWFDIAGASCLVSRSGYTGEDGFEISVPEAAAIGLARALLASPEVKLIGLAARDTLRLEAGLPLYGSDLDASTTPVEAGLGWSIPASRRAGGAKAGGFPGAAMVLRELAEGARRRSAGFVGDDAVPVRAGAPLGNESGETVGQVTSGTVSPSLGRPVMLARVDAAHAAGAASYATVRGRRHRVREVPLPFVIKRYKR